MSAGQEEADLWGLADPGQPHEGVAIDVVHLDLASLASVHNAAGAIRSAYPRPDLLINNAGVMEPPYEQTEDAFDLRSGTVFGRGVSTRS